MDGFGVVRVPQKCSVLLRKEQARNKNRKRKQEPYEAGDRSARSVSPASFFYEYEQEYNRAHSLEMRGNHLQRESLGRQIPSLQKKLERKESREMKLELWQLQEQLEETPELKPICSFANDCSSEALTSLMAANDGVFSVLSTEGGIFDIMAGRYSNKFNIDVRAERPLWGCHLCGSNDP